MSVVRPRAESEFSCGGEADIVRPVNNENMTDREWGEYVFMRENKRGLHKEQWLHTQAAAAGSRPPATR